MKAAAPKSDPKWTQEESAMGKPALDCVTNGTIELYLNTPAFWADPDTALKRMQQDWGAEFARQDWPKEVTDALGLKCAFVALQALIPVRDVADFILDYASLKDNPVRVKGYYQRAGDLHYLFTRKGSTVFVMVNIAGLPREARKRLLVQCDPGCPATILGKAEDVFANKGIKAGAVE